MDAKPFTFDPSLIPLVLDGRKTQSRRLDRKFNVGDEFYPVSLPADLVKFLAFGFFVAPIFKITRVWLEPVCEISVPDTKAEGFRCSDYDYCAGSHANKCLYSPPCWVRFSKLIESYYPGIWQRNGLVWVHEWRPVC